MFNIMLSKFSFYFIIFILGLVIIAYTNLIVEKHANTSHEIEFIKKITLEKKTSIVIEKIEVLAEKEIIFMDNIPVKNGNISSKYGIRKDPFNGRKRMHYGIDIAAQSGTSIYPLGKGKVIFSGRKAGYGNLVEVLHGTAIVSRYAHIKKSLVKKGQMVGKKDIIAKVGSTGRSTGPHLHLEITINGETLDPEIFLCSTIAYNKF
jgi:murein DD-endopeptidase MepM/ murein hydrolase activator NlpD